MKVSHTVSLRSLLVLFLLLVSVGAAASSAFVSNSTLTPDSCVGAAASSAFVSTSTLTPSSCVGDGRGLMEIHAPAGSTWAGMGPWGWFYGVDSNGNPNMLSVDPSGITCIITDVCGYQGGQWRIIVKLPDGTTRDSGIFDMSQQSAGNNAACYYSFDASGTPPPTPQLSATAVVISAPPDVHDEPLMFETYDVRVVVQNTGTQDAHGSITCNEVPDPYSWPLIPYAYWRDTPTPYQNPQTLPFNAPKGGNSVVAFRYKHQWRWLRFLELEGWRPLYGVIPFANYMSNTKYFTTIRFADMIANAGMAKQDLSYTYYFGTDQQIQGLHSVNTKVDVPITKKQAFLRSYLWGAFAGATLSMGTEVAATGNLYVTGICGGAAGLLIGGSIWDQQNAVDPAMNYQEFVERKTISLQDFADLPELPSKAVLYNLAHVLEDTRALDEALNAYDNAAAAEDEEWMKIHLNEAVIYGNLARSDLAKFRTSMSLLSQDLGGTTQITDERIEGIKQDILQNGLPDRARKVLSTNGFTDQEIEDGTQFAIAGISNEFIKSYDTSYPALLDSLDSTLQELVETAETELGGYSPVELPPKAQFTSDITQGYAPLSVQFNAVPIHSPDSFAWDFGDGSTSNEQEPVHVYTHAGTYAVTLTVSNAYGTDTLRKEAYITTNTKPLPPKAKFIPVPMAGNAPLKVEFRDASRDASSWLWNFDDGFSSLSRSPSHTYDACGIYRPVLTASNDGGVSTKTGLILVNAHVPKLIPEFKPRMSAGKVPLTVQFTDTSKGPVSWLWKFGDGDTSMERNPTHVYRNTGMYFVTLQIENADGRSSCKFGFVVASDPRDNGKGQGTDADHDSLRKMIEQDTYPGDSGRGEYSEDSGSGAYRGGSGREEDGDHDHTQGHD